MARLKQLTDNEASSEAGALFTAIKAKLGMVPNLYRVAGNQPAVLGALLGLTENLAGGSFDGETREAIALAVAGVNECDYCASAHAAISKGMKVADDKITDYLAARADDPKLAAILALAVEITEARGKVPDAALSKARAAGLGDAEIVEVVANVVANIFTNYLNHVAETDIDFPVLSSKAA